MSICPICGKEVTPRSVNKAFPFCTARCKSIDLGKWLNEDYRVPATPDEAGEGDEGAVTETDDTPDEDDEANEERDDAERGSPAKADMRH